MIEDALRQFCKEWFYDALYPFFNAVDNLLNKIPTSPWASIFAIGLFVTAMVVVNFVIKESYVNRGRPHKVWYTDLRLWTIVCMLPHVLVYFYFR